MNAVELLARRLNVYTIMETRPLAPELRKMLMEELKRLDEQMESLVEGETTASVEKSG